MTFHTDGVPHFLKTFEDRKATIAAFSGCMGVQLLRDADNPNIFFTYSKWKSADDLENYRSSKFFVETWQLAKQHFSAKPKAWSVLEV